VLQNEIIQLLACPYCRGDLTIDDTNAGCSVCEKEYPRTEQGQFDFRLYEIKKDTLSVEFRSVDLPEKSFGYDFLPIDKDTEVDYRGIDVPHHLTAEILSHIPKAKNKDAVVLDLGCGDTIHKDVCERAGYIYLGLDIDSQEAHILGDAQALPFKDQSVDFIFSIAVLEHIKIPLLMMRECYRVLKPGGKIIGTVSYLEPFHGDSYYHHTHLGTYQSVTSSGFEVDHVSPNPNWSGLVAQTQMRLFPRFPRSISKWFPFPLYLLHRLYWKVAYAITKQYKASEIFRQLTTTGAFFFVAKKAN
jgi:SAM-dependent methyltransferase